MACDKLYWCQLKGPDPAVGVILQRNKIKVNLLSPAVGTGLSIIDQNTCISIFQSLRPQPFFNRPQAPSIRRCKENGKLICIGLPELYTETGLKGNYSRNVIVTGTGATDSSILSLSPMTSCPAVWPADAPSFPVPVTITFRL